MPELDEVNCRVCSQRGFSASAWHDFSHLSSLFAGASREKLLIFVDVEFGSEIMRRGDSGKGETLNDCWSSLKDAERTEDAMPMT